jgi:CheY-like chemotaxis protein
MKVLLIDDDVFLRDMYATKFGECDHQVEAVDHAEKAIRLLEEPHDYDVILIDMVMPGMSGVDLLHELHTKKLLNGAVCVVLSNQGQQADIDEALAAGAVSYIVKAEHVPSDVVERVQSIVKEYKGKSQKN